MKVNTGEAKNKLSELIHVLQSGQESEIIIANKGLPVVKMVLYTEQDLPPRKLGMGKGKYVIPDDIDECNDEIVEMFGV